MDYYTYKRDDSADNLIQKFHYSGYVPSNIQYCISLIRDEVTIASIYYSIPSTRWSYPVLELCRLVRDENMLPKHHLTSLISESIKTIKRDKRFHLLISFADSTHSHHGGVYQAASWNYHTQRRPSHDGFIIDGKFVPRRTCNHRYGTSGKRLENILESKGISCTVHYDKGKYLYWKSISKIGDSISKSLKLQKNPYPKPSSKIT